MFAIGLLFHSIFLYFLPFGFLLSGFLAAIFGMSAMLGCALLIYRRRFFVALSLSVFVIAVWGIWILAPTREVGKTVKFWYEEADYLMAVEELKRTGNPRCVALGKCGIDDGPPLRLVFSWGGLLNNWGGVVYDPSGLVMYQVRPRSLLGSELIRCEHLKEDFYLCGFN